MVDIAASFQFFNFLSAQGQAVSSLSGSFFFQSVIFDTLLCLCLGVGDGGGSNQGRLMIGNVFTYRQQKKSGRWCHT